MIASTQHIRLFITRTIADFEFGFDRNYGRDRNRYGPTSLPRPGSAVAIAGLRRFRQFLRSIQQLRGFRTAFCLAAFTAFLELPFREMLDLFSVQRDSPSHGPSLYTFNDGCGHGTNDSLVTP